jgi:hypothetical protein
LAQNVACTEQPVTLAPRQAAEGRFMFAVLAGQFAVRMESRALPLRPFGYLRRERLRDVDAEQLAHHLAGLQEQVIAQRGARIGQRCRVGRER